MACINLKTDLAVLLVSGSRACLGRGSVGEGKSLGLYLYVFPCECGILSLPLVYVCVMWKPVVLSCRPAISLTLPTPVTRIPHKISTRV